MKPSALTGRPKWRFAGRKPNRRAAVRAWLDDGAKLPQGFLHPRFEKVELRKDFVLARFQFDDRLIGRWKGARHGRTQVGTKGQDRIDQHRPA